ncbi:Transcriptional regulator, TetR family protein [Minicystis rosea]|nr:Transcriptional regulator, TetR family protein [Minicystis rosea]
MKNVTSTDETLAEGEYRERLLAAVLEGLGDVGWADLTIAEIVRRARVSKRTFYEHFETKDACLLALYESVSSHLLDELDTAIERLPRGEGRIEAGATFYLARLQERPRVVRALAIEILHLGSEGLAIRRRVMRRFAAFLRREINAEGRRPPISTAVAMVIVGGINELTLEAFEEDRVDRLAELVEPIVEVVRGVLHGGGAQGTTKRRRASGD